MSDKVTVPCDIRAVPIDQSDHVAVFVDNNKNPAYRSEFSEEQYVRVVQINDSDYVSIKIDGKVHVIPIDRIVQDDQSTWQLLLNCNVRKIFLQNFLWNPANQSINEDLGKIDLSNQQNDKLQNFRNYVVDEKLKSCMNKTETDHIKDAVEKSVERFISKVCEKRLGFEYPVGSMAEGTKLNDPDEFDFIVRIPHTLFLFNPFSDCDECEHLSVLGNHIHLRKSTGELLKVSDVLGVSDIKKDIDIEEPTPSGRMKIESYSFSNGPAVTLEMIWNSNNGEQMPISVDIVFAISIPVKKDVECLGELTRLHTYLKEVEQDDILVIPCRTTPTDSSNVCFKFSLTIAEVAAVSKLSDEHISCYKFLKFVFKENGALTDKILQKVIFSYLLKIPVLRHAAKCKNGTNCLFEIISEVNETVSLHCKFLFKSKRIAQVCSMPHLQNEIAKCMKTLITVLNEIGTSVKENEQLYEDFCTRRKEAAKSWMQKVFDRVPETLELIRLRSLFNR